MQEVETIQGELRSFGFRLDSSLKHLRLVVISDPHYGNPFHSPRHFARTLDFIRKWDDVRTVLTGDLIEAITKNSVGDIYSQKLTPQEQRDDMIEMLMPIKDKVLAMCTGNHERRIYGETGIDVSRDIAKALGVPYRPEGVLLKIMLGSGNERHLNRPYVFWGYCTHGYGGARTKSAKAVKVERVSAWVSKADFVTMAHDHVVNIAPDIDLIPDVRQTVDKSTGFLTGKVVAHRKMLIKTNAYIKWGGYAETGGFPPVDIATPVIMLLTPDSEYWELLPDRPQQGVKVIG